MTTPNGRATATVETLAAEVHVLKVGSRQITMSVYNQLDYVKPDEIEPFGRIRPRDAEWNMLYVVGRSLRTQDEGSLVRSSNPSARAVADFKEQEPRPGSGLTAGYKWRRATRDERVAMEKVAAAWNPLPLIVLAGLR